MEDQVVSPLIGGKQAAGGQHGLLFLDQLYGKKLTAENP